MNIKYYIVPGMVISIAVATLFCFSKQVTQFPKQEELLNAKWKVINIEYKIIEKGVDVSFYNYTGSPADYMAFTITNKLFSSIRNKKEVMPYILTSDNKLICDNDTISIKNLTSEKCTLHQKNGTSNNYTEKIINLIK